MYSLPGPRFFAFADRMAAYDGVISARQQQERDGREKRGGTTVGEATYREVSADTTSQISAGLGDLIEVAEV